MPDTPEARAAKLLVLDQCGGCWGEQDHQAGRACNDNECIKWHERIILRENARHYLPMLRAAADDLDAAMLPKAAGRLQVEIDRLEEAKET